MSRHGILVLALSLSLSACKAEQSPDASEAKSLATSSTVVPYSRHPGVFRLMPQTCTATAIAPNKLLTAAHCIEPAGSGGFGEVSPVDYVDVFLVGAKEELAARVDAQKLERWTPEYPITQGRGGFYMPAGLSYRSTRVARLVAFPAHDEPTRALNPLVGQGKQSAGVGQNEFWGENGNTVGALDVAVVHFDRPIFKDVIPVDFNYAPNAADQVVSVGHGRYDEAGAFDGQRREGRVSAAVKGFGVLRAQAPRGTATEQVLSGGDSGGPLLVATSDGYKITGVAHAAVLIGGNTVYGGIADVPEAVKADPTTPLVYENVWIDLGAPAVRDFLEKELAQ